MMKILTVYYSYSCGNTKKIAEKLHKILDGDIERIETVKTYGGYEETVEIGQQEVQQSYCPPLRPLTYDVADYDVIAIGSPTWWYTMAPAMRTFVTKQDFKDKKLILFSTHGGWPGQVIKHMKSFTHGKEILGSLEIQFDSTGGNQQVTPQKDVETWLAQMKEKVDAL